MLNKIIIFGKITTDLTVINKEDYSNCKFDISVAQPILKGVDTVEKDIFNCIAVDDNAKTVNFLYSKGRLITFVGSFRKDTDDMEVIIVKELHFKNKFAVTVDVDSDRLF